MIVALLIILIVLMQRPKNEGLGAAFGGGMTENLFGAQTTNVLANITRWLGGLFFGISLILTYIYAHETGQVSSVSKRLSSAPVPVAATPAPATPAPTAPGATLPAPATTPAPAATTPAESAAPATPPSSVAPETPAAAPAPATGAVPAPAPVVPVPVTTPGAQ